MPTPPHRGRSVTIAAVRITGGLEREIRVAIREDLLAARRVTVDDVLDSRMIAWPFRKLMCCLVTDGGGALVLTAADRADDFPQPPVHVLGAGESSESPLVSQMDDFTVSAAFRRSGALAFAEAGLGPTDVDHLMAYDAFVHTPRRRAEEALFQAGLATIVDEQPVVTHADPVLTDGVIYFYLVR